MKLKTILLALLFTGLYSCNDDDNNCTNTTINTTSLESEYGCINTKFQTDINLGDDFTIIESQPEYDAFVTGSCQPAINFVLYDLVIGKKALTSGNTSIEYKLVEDCKTDNQMLTVTFHQNATAEAPNLTYHALIPKLDATQQLEVEIIIDGQTL